MPHELPCSVPHIILLCLCIYREYITTDVAEFARNNPHLTVYVRQRPGRHPRIVAEFCTYITQCSYKFLLCIITVHTVYQRVGRLSM